MDHRLLQHCLIFYYYCVQRTAFKLLFGRIVIYLTLPNQELQKLCAAQGLSPKFSEGSSQEKVRRTRHWSSSQQFWGGCSFHLILSLEHVLLCPKNVPSGYWWSWVLFLGDTLEPKVWLSEWRTVAHMPCTDRCLDISWAAVGSSRQVARQKHGQQQIV